MRIITLGEALGAEDLGQLVEGQVRGDDNRAALIALGDVQFQRTYNETLIIQRHGYRTPAQVRRDQTTIMQTAA